MADSDTGFTLKVMAGFVLWIVALLAVAVLNFSDDGDALAKDRAISSGSIERATATMDVQNVKRARRTKRTGRDLEGFFSSPELSTLDITDRGSGRRGFEPRGGNDVLKKWDGTEVTVLVWKHQIVGFETSDGTVVKGDDVGWWGLVKRWSLGTASLGLALISIGIAVAARRILVPLGLVLFVPGVVALCHSLSLFWGIVIDVVLVVVLGLWTYVVVKGRTRPSANVSDRDV